MNDMQSSRRDFLKIAATAGGGLIIGVPLASCSSSPNLPQSVAGSYEHDAFIQITPTSEVNFYVPRIEMGQGTYNGLSTLIAEELSTSPDLITAKHAPVAKAYRNPDYSMQVTGASNSMRVHYKQLRQSAADTRAAILGAASEQLGVPVNELRLDNAFVVYREDRHPFGDFVELARTRPIPTATPWKAAQDYLFIGKDLPRIDAREKSTGSTQFGLDVDFPGLKRAVLVRCPVAGGRVKSHDDVNAKAMPGVRAIVPLDSGVAIVADNYWQARQAAATLEIDWELPELANFSSDGYRLALQSALDSEEGKQAYHEGEGAKPLKTAQRVITAEYWAPYLAHATMEPMNCTVKLEGDRCEIWVGCQNPEVARGIASHASGIKQDNITVNVTFLGGGFGRRLYSDYVEEAVQIAQASGLPVQLVWSREDDMQHDWYRPASLARFAATVDDQGLIETYTVKRAGPNKFPYEVQEALPAISKGILPISISRWMGGVSHGIFEDWMLDHSSVEGLYEDYDAPNKEARHVTVRAGVRVGSWRSVGHSFSGFFAESFIDELAHTAARDPVQFRLDNSKSDPRFQEVIRLAAEKSLWGSPLTPGSSQGFAAHRSFGTWVAQVAEVTVQGNEIIVHRVTCAVDCGLAINPDIIRAQMESGIIFGLTAAFYGQIDLVNGAVQQSNFHDYQMLRMPQAPAIDVFIVASQEQPTGVGEPGVPPIAPAVANAVFKATGRRLRSLPFDLS